MLKHVFLSVLAILGTRDLIHLNLINHLLKSDLGGEKHGSLCLASSCLYQTALAVDFIISVSSGLRRERALRKRAVVHFLLSPQ